MITRSVTFGPRFVSEGTKTPPRRMFPFLRPLEVVRVVEQRRFREATVVTAQVALRFVMTFGSISAQNAIREFQQAYNADPMHDLVVYTTGAWDQASRNAINEVLGTAIGQTGAIAPFGVYRTLGANPGSFQASTVQAANALLAFLKSTGCAGSQSRTQAFQAAYAQDGAGTITVTGANGTVDGVFDDATRGALAEVLGKLNDNGSGSITIAADVPATCSLPGLPAVLPAKPGGATNVVITNQTSSGSSATPWLIGAAVLAVGAGAAWWLTKKPMAMAHRSVRMPRARRRR